MDTPAFGDIAAATCAGKDFATEVEVTVEIGSVVLGLVVPSQLAWIPVNHFVVFCHYPRYHPHRNSPVASASLETATQELIQTLLP